MMTKQPPVVPKLPPEQGKNLPAPPPRPKPPTPKEKEGESEEKQGDEANGAAAPPRPPPPKISTSEPSQEDAASEDKPANDDEERDEAADDVAPLNMPKKNPKLYQLVQMSQEGSSFWWDSVDAAGQAYVEDDEDDIDMAMFNSSFESEISLRVVEEGGD